MSRLLEILGAGIAIDTAELIWHWLDTVRLSPEDCQSSRYRQLNEAVELIRDRKLDAAEEQLSLYLFENPSCILGRLALAAIHLHNNRLQKAVEELKSVYKHQPNNTMALYALGHCYERLGQESQAVAFYQDCLKFKNYLQLPAQRLAAIYFKNGQVEKAIQQYELLKNEYPGDISSLVTLGHLYITAAKYRESIETFNKAILMHPDNFHVDDEYLFKLVNDGRLHESLDYLDNVLQQHPERADLVLKRGDVLNLLGAHDEALEQFRQAIRICPDFLEGFIKLGAQYTQLHHDHLAAKQFNMALEINDKIIDAYIGLSISQKLAGRDSEAKGTLSLAAALQPNSSLLFAETASLHFKSRLGDDFSFSSTESTTLIDAVIAVHRQQIGHRPNNPDLHYRLGLLMLSVNRTSEALKCFHNALQLNPTYHRARSKYAICLFEINECDKAFEILIPPYATPTVQNSLEIHYKVSLLYCNRPKFASSLINLEHILHDNFASSEPSSNISIVIQNLGLLEREIATWDNLSYTAEQSMKPDLPT